MPPIRRVPPRVEPPPSKPMRLAPSAGALARYNWKNDDCLRGGLGTRSGRRETRTGCSCRVHLRGAEGHLARECQSHAFGRRILAVARQPTSDLRSTLASPAGKRRRTRRACRSTPRTAPAFRLRRANPIGRQCAVSFWPKGVTDVGSSRSCDCDLRPLPLVFRALAGCGGCLLWHFSMFPWLRATKGRHSVRPSLSGSVLFPVHSFIDVGPRGTMRPDCQDGDRRISLASDEDSLRSRASRPTPSGVCGAAASSPPQSG